MNLKGIDALRISYLFNVDSKNLDIPSNEIFTHNNYKKF